MDNFTNEEIELIKIHNMNEVLKNIDIPEQSRNIYRDYIILWKDLSEVSKKYKIAPKRIKIIINGVSKLIGEYEKSKIKMPHISNEDILTNPCASEGG